MVNSKSKDSGILWLPESTHDRSINRARERIPACSGHCGKVTVLCVNYLTRGFKGSVSLGYLRLGLYYESIAQWVSRVSSLYDGQEVDHWQEEAVDRH